MTTATLPPLYQEKYRPQFHFSAKQHWLNDPNGCVFFEGEYHLFYQHNPEDRVWGNMSWGHAVSRDLVHWEELPIALRPFGEGTIYSGTAVVDYQNTSGLGKDGQPPLIAIFTYAKKPFHQAIAYSHDKGHTWEYFRDGTAVVPNQGLDEGERDPKVFWHSPSGQWVMVLWVAHGSCRFFNSANLIDWRHTSDFTTEGTFYECPDLIELPVDGDPANTQWVLYDAAFNYWIGDFDGEKFTPDGPSQRADFGTHFYAAQTWNNVRDRTLQIGWLRVTDEGAYPGMPFNQQMGIVSELTLQTTPQGLRVCREPVCEIARLYDVEHEATGELSAGETLTFGDPHDLWDIELLVDLAEGAGLTVHVAGQDIVYAAGQLTVCGHTCALPLIAGELHLRILADRTSMEVFGGQGDVAISAYCLADNAAPVMITAVGGKVALRNSEVRELKSAWR